LIDGFFPFFLSFILSLFPLYFFVVPVCAQDPVLLNYRQPFFNVAPPIKLFRFTAERLGDETVDVLGSNFSFFFSCLSYFSPAAGGIFNG
jgi:hypothetical protein